MRLRRAILAFALLTPIAAAAQGFPERPIRMIVPNPPGGVSDITARLACARIQAELGQPCVAENRAGAAGSIAAAAVARAAPDGYTILLATSATHGTNPSTIAGLPYDAVADFAPITLLAQSPLALVVRPESPIRSVTDLVAQSRDRQLSYGSTGTGGSVHLSVESFRAMSRADLLHVPYRGSAPALTDLMAGQLDFLFDNLSSAMPLAQDGRLRAIAVTTAQRTALAPEMPTVAETGLPGYAAATWVALLAPRATPEARLEAVNQAVAPWIRSAEGRAAMMRAGVDPVGSSRAEMGAFLRAEVTRWAEVVRAAGLTPGALPQ